MKTKFLVAFLAFGFIAMAAAPVQNEKSEKETQQAPFEVGVITFEGNQYLVVESKGFISLCPRQTPKGKPELKEVPLNREEEKKSKEY